MRLVSERCPTCGVVHFKLEVYKRWLIEYRTPKNRLAEQAIHWQAIVDKHTKTK